jgi:hypothetical protein
MTLPLISYGGSSTIALCIGVGFLLAITRRNPYLAQDPLRQGPDCRSTLSPVQFRQIPQHQQVSLPPMSQVSRHYVLAAGDTAAI